MNPEKKAQCTVVVTRDDTALDVAIKAAEEKIREENFEINIQKLQKQLLEKIWRMRNLRKRTRTFLWKM